MFNLVNEKEKYLIVCMSLKGLSDLTLKAYNKMHSRMRHYEYLITYIDNKKYRRS